ncbi:LysR family transcriptional regulator [Rhizobium sp. BK602]|uniref:LysR family transcriptional regulator n=1 Tax=Rhizobium sp. BK602 TaxID=2586986 RepID=UPI001614D75F|nr:LysR family transcriptional regulator [Rhizobium sp. BK602]MBB3612134.1 LysR family transcriptional regulator for bpeEF and oprC [Rhizobium sp. BK602]
MDFVQQLRIFVAVVDNGSFARAAEALRMARPGVTNAVRGLEGMVGARLLHRTTRRISLTGEGELFHERAVRLLADVSDVRNLFGGSADTPRGRLRIDIPVALAKPLIIPRLPEFSRRYPGIELILGVSDQPADLIAEGIDCVLRLGSLPAGSMVSRLIAHARMVICASPGYLTEHGTPQSIEDLAAHRAVLYFSGRGRRIMEWQMPENGRHHTVKMPPAILVNDTEAFIACALAGYGLIQVAGTSVAEHLEAGRLVQVLPDSQAFRLPLSIMYPNREHLAPQVRVFIDWIAALFRSLDSRWIERP